MFRHSPLHAFLTFLLVFVLLAHPAPACGRSLKSSLRFAKGATDPSASLVFKDAVGSLTVEMPDIGLTPEVWGPLNSDRSSVAKPLSANTAGNAGAPSASKGKRSFVLMPYPAAEFPSTYRLVLRGTATRSGKASIRGQYPSRSSSGCEGFDWCMPTGLQAILLSPLIITFLVVMVVEARIEDRRMRKGEKEKLLLPTRLEAKAESEFAEGSPGRLRLDVDQGILLTPKRVTVTETCRPDRKAMVTQIDPGSVILQKWHTFIVTYVPQQSGFCALEVAVEGQNWNRDFYGLTAKINALKVRSVERNASTRP